MDSSLLFFVYSLGADNRGLVVFFVICFIEKRKYQLKVWIKDGGWQDQDGG